jgi:hypothetical protein
MKSLSYNTYTSLYFDVNSSKQFDCLNEFAFVNDNASYYYASNIEFDFIKRNLDIRNKNIECKLKEDSELLTFVYDCLRVLVDQNVYWAGELDLIEDEFVDGENKFLFIYRSKEISNGQFFNEKSSKSKKELYRFFLKKLFKQSKQMRKSFILDERTL